MDAQTTAAMGQLASLEGGTARSLSSTQWLARQVNLAFV